MNRYYLYNDLGFIGNLYENDEEQGRFNPCCWFYNEEGKLCRTFRVQTLRKTGLKLVHVEYRNEDVNFSNETNRDQARMDSADSSGNFQSRMDKIGDRTSDRGEPGEQVASSSASGSV